MFTNASNLFFIATASCPAATDRLLQQSSFPQNPPTTTPAGRGDHKGILPHNTSNTSNPTNNSSPVHTPSTSSSMPPTTSCHSTQSTPHKPPSGRGDHKGFQSPPNQPKRRTRNTRDPLDHTHSPSSMTTTTSVLTDNVHQRLQPLLHRDSLLPSRHGQTPPTVFIPAESTHHNARRAGGSQGDSSPQHVQHV